MPTALEFFAGSGLVRLGLTPYFKTVWANDVCAKKRDTFVASFPKDNFVLDDLRKLAEENFPHAELAWASFPCQDLSLAGNLSGIDSRTRSGPFGES